MQLTNIKAFIWREKCSWRHDLFLNVCSFRQAWFSVNCFTFEILSTCGKISLYIIYCTKRKLLSTCHQCYNGNCFLQSALGINSYKPNLPVVDVKKLRSRWRYTYTYTGWKGWLLLQLWLDLTNLDVRWPLLFFAETDLIRNYLHIVQKINVGSLKKFKISVHGTSNHAILRLQGAWNYGR